MFPTTARMRSRCFSVDRDHTRAGAAPRTTELDTDPAFRDACGTQSYPRLVLAGVRLRVGWTVLALALACELPQYLLLWSFYADDGWPIPARRETDGLALAAVYAAITALLAWLSRRYSHRKNELVPAAACVAICAATWAPLPGPDWAAGGGFVYAIASMAWPGARCAAKPAAVATRTSTLSPRPTRPSCDSSRAPEIERATRFAAAAWPALGPPRSWDSGSQRLGCREC